MSSEDIRLVITVMPSVIVMVGILIDNVRISGSRTELGGQISDMHREMNSRFEDFIRLMDTRFQPQNEKLYRVERQFDTRLKHLEERKR